MDLIDRSLPLDLVLEFAEEIKRSGRSIPSATFLQKYSTQKVQMQNAMLIASLDMSQDLLPIVQSAPKGGELFERIRRRALNE